MLSQASLASSSKYAKRSIEAYPKFKNEISKFPQVWEVFEATASTQGLGYLLKPGFRAPSISDPDWDEFCVDNEFLHSVLIRSTNGTMLDTMVWQHCKDKDGVAAVNAL